MICWVRRRAASDTGLGSEVEARFETGWTALMRDHGLGDTGARSLLRQDQQSSISGSLSPGTAPSTDAMSLLPRQWRPATGRRSFSSVDHAVKALTPWPVVKVLADESPELLPERDITARREPGGSFDRAGLVRSSRRGRIRPGLICAEDIPNRGCPRS